MSSRRSASRTNRGNASTHIRSSVRPKERDRRPPKTIGACSRGRGTSGSSFASSSSAGTSGSPARRSGDGNGRRDDCRDGSGGAANGRSIDNADPRAVRSQQALTDAFLKLLEAKPLDQVSIRDIAATAGVGYTTFFRHHASKEELLDHIAAEQIRTLFNLALPVMDAYDVHSGSTALFTYVDAHRALWSTLLTGGAAGTIREEFRRSGLRGRGLARAAEHLVARRRRRRSLIVGGTLDLLAWWLRQSDPLPIERIVEHPSNASSWRPSSTRAAQRDAAGSLLRSHSTLAAPVTRTRRGRSAFMS